MGGASVAGIVPTATHARPAPSGVARRARAAFPSDDASGAVTRGTEGTEGTKG